MFVKINNKDKSVVYLDREIKATRNDGKITPDFAMGILSMTNHSSNIKILVRAIKENCKTKQQLKPYREFILSCVDGREMSPNALEMLSELAILCGCNDEFVKANKRSKIYEINDCDNIDIKVVKSKEELMALTGDNLRVIFDSYEVFLTDYDFSKIKMLSFKEGASVYLNRSKNLPEFLDVSNCYKVDLYGCDLLPVRTLRFRENSEVRLDTSHNLPEVLDLSMCSKVSMVYCDLANIKDIKFRENAIINLYGAENLTLGLDVSMGSSVNLMNCDLSGIKELKFRDKAQVFLGGAMNLPKSLDFSMCSLVDLRDCDLTDVERIIFKDKAQEKEFMDSDKSFSGEVVYVREDKKINTLQNNVKLEM